MSLELLDQIINGDYTAPYLGEVADSVGTPVRKRAEEFLQWLKARRTFCFKVKPTPVGLNCAFDDTSFIAPGFSVSAKLITDRGMEFNISPFQATDTMTRSGFGIQTDSLNQFSPEQVTDMIFNNQLKAVVVFGDEISCSKLFPRRSAAEIVHKMAAELRTALSTGFGNYPGDDTDILRYQTRSGTNAEERKSIRTLANLFFNTNLNSRDTIHDVMQAVKDAPFCNDFGIKNADHLLIVMRFAIDVLNAGNVFETGRTRACDFTAYYTKMIERFINAHPGVGMRLGYVDYRRELKLPPENAIAALIEFFDGKILEQPKRRR